MYNLIVLIFSGTKGENILGWCIVTLAEALAKSLAVAITFNKLLAIL